MKVKFSLPEGSVTIKQQIGIAQGDPLSPTLFNLVINIVLEMLNSEKMKKHGITLYGKKRITFADDINIVGRSVEDSKIIINRLMESLNWTKTLKAEPSKFGVVQFTKIEGKFMTKDPDIEIQEKRVPFLLKENETFRFLGRHFGDPSDSTSVKEYVKNEIYQKLTKLEDSGFNFTE